MLNMMLKCSGGINGNYNCFLPGDRGSSPHQNLNFKICTMYNCNQILTCISHWNFLLLLHVSPCRKIMA